MSSDPPVDKARLRAALARTTDALLAARAPGGHWVGELSSSALSTATAVTALAVVGREVQSSKFQAQIDSGLRWLAAHANTDGGWGDTTLSFSNLSTTALGWAAFGAVPGADESFSPTVRRAEQWLANQITPAGNTNEQPLATDALARAIVARYGKDRTFSVPILTMCALAGRLGDGRDAWQHVIPLPFELAACPHQLFAALRLPVVSYALPALIAIGQARHHHAPSRNPLTRLIRQATREKTLRVLAGIQPSNGGFLEATPLTSFVTMSLAGSGHARHVVTERGVEFLLRSQRIDGSWPIDTNLATWLTTLAVNALGHAPAAPIDRPEAILDWLLSQQHRIQHPYTHATPGGWAWTDLPGGVPDADDTAGALLAITRLQNADRGTKRNQIVRAAESGIRWLVDLQNRDGGIPTFCRGWGALPFDRSSADITAHAIHAWLAWHNELPSPLQSRIRHAVRRAVEFLQSSQRPDGAWSPLWFGNQHSINEENLVYGTSKVLTALVAVAHFDSSQPAPNRVGLLPAQTTMRAVAWLLASQRRDGGWGGGGDSPASNEETALALDALASLLHPGPLIGDLTTIEAAIKNGAAWLIARVESGEWSRPSPIGFYFAKLWYYEKLYPLIFTVGALKRVATLWTTADAASVASGRK